MTARPPVTVSGGPAPVPEPPPRPTGPLLAAGAAVLVAGLVVAELLSPAAPGPVPVDAALRLVPRDIVTSRSGVLVVPVDVVNSGPAVRVVDPVLDAEPVGQPPATGGRTRVPAGGTGRVVALVQPDCAALGPDGFRATLTLTLQTQARAEQRLSVDVGADPAVAQAVAGACVGGTPLPADPPAARVPPRR